MVQHEKPIMSTRAALLWVGRFVAPALIVLSCAATLSPAAADWLGDKRDAIAVAQTRGLRGPVEIGIGDQGKLVIPAGMTFASTTVSRRFGELFGRSPMEAALLGVVTSSKLGEDWVATISYVQPGHISDDKAADWSPDALLSGLANDANARVEGLRKLGLPVRRVDGWMAEPTYDAGKRTLAWSVRYRPEEGMPSLNEPVQTTSYVLGRTAYYIIDMHGAPAQAAAYGKIVKQIAAGASFSETQRYEAFDAQKDAEARAGLARILSAKPSQAGKPVIFDFWVISLILLAGLFGAGIVVQRIMGAMMTSDTPAGSIRR